MTPDAIIMLRDGVAGTQSPIPAYKLGATINKMLAEHADGTMEYDAGLIGVDVVSAQASRAVLAQSSALANTVASIESEFVGFKNEIAMNDKSSIDGTCDVAMLLFMSPDGERCVEGISLDDNGLIRLSEALSDALGTSVTMHAEPCASRRQMALRRLSGYHDVMPSTQLVCLVAALACAVATSMSGSVAMHVSAWECVGLWCVFGVLKTLSAAYGSGEMSASFMLHDFRAPHELRGYYRRAETSHAITYAVIMAMSVANAVLVIC